MTTTPPLDAQPIIRRVFLAGGAEALRKAADGIDRHDLRAMTAAELRTLADKIDPRQETAP